MPAAPAGVVRVAISVAVVLPATAEPRVVMPWPMLEPPPEPPQDWLKRSCRTAPGTSASPQKLLPKSISVHDRFGFCRKSSRIGCARRFLTARGVTTPEA